jgi:hypothetical protein
MRAEPLNIDFREELRAWQGERSRSRTPGRHLSDIVSRIIKQVDPGRYPDGPGDPALFQQGFIWEDVLSLVFARQFGSAQQIETESDGIIMTLDGLRVGSGPSSPSRVQEFKASKMSAGNPITSQKFLPWMIRTAGYCHAMDTNEAEIVVLFLNGSYELGGGRFGATVPKGWRIIFTPQEIREHWEWILRTRDQIEKEEKRNR